MKRRLFNALTVLSLVLFLPLAAVWIVGQFREDNFYYYTWQEATRQTTEINVHWGKGHLQTSYEWHLLPDMPSLLKGIAKQPIFRRTPGTGEFTVKWLGWFHNYDLPDHGEWIFGARLWPLVLSTSLLPAVWLTRLLRSRGRAGQCPNCGYDLRATPERCPECGTESHREEAKAAKT